MFFKGKGPAGVDAPGQERASSIKVADEMPERVDPADKESAER